MKTLSLALAAAFAVAAPLSAQAPAPSAQEIARWKAEASHITIVRDDWGIAHVHGTTDAEAVFGMEYAQAEDDFNRVETNYRTALGRMAEADGESGIWTDLRAKLFVNPEDLKAKYAASPAWLQQLMNGFADGLNFYLYTHPQVHPRAIRHFEPWMALAFSEGSIGGDIERANLRGLQAFYGRQPGGVTPPPPPPEPPAYLPPDPGGSNGIAIGPKITADHHAMLMINPHTSFYFRSELQMSSDQGLDAYGAVTWGQFFIYQGFNPRLGWMHTSSGVDNVDFYLETVTRQGDHYVYKYGDKELPVKQAVIEVPYKDGDRMATRSFTAYWTQHGPVIGEVNGKWETISLMQRPMRALEQDFERTKAHNYKEFLQTMQLHTNSSNNTIYADADGHIAYFHSNFIPRRDPSFDWTKPVDGSNPATDWKGLLSVDETPHLLDPATGWLYNSNNWPWSAAGPDSPKRTDFPVYVDKGRFESMRGVHAVKVLSAAKGLTLDTMISSIAFDSYQPWFTHTIPVLIEAWDAASASNPLKEKLRQPIAALRAWNLRWGADSIPTSVAVYWGGQIMRTTGQAARRAVEDDSTYVSTQATPQQLLDALSAAVDKLTADFGSWKTPWGQINRFQRLDDSIAHPKFDDSLPSTPVEFTTAVWGSLASFAARQYPGTKRIYGSSGNSFVAGIDFGPIIRARAVTAGGESGNPASPHFRDEAKRYATGNLRTVYFYPAQLKGHAEKTYHPGE
ncbi:MAG TPA: penicillin acylase family protein [Terriglobales bacterium]|nr:penicillin acylase family protein [Terriglobales bacterium]